MHDVTASSPLSS